MGKQSGTFFKEQPRGPGSRASTLSKRGSHEMAFAFCSPDEGTSTTDSLPVPGAAGSLCLYRSRPYIFGGSFQRAPAGV